ncbi:stonustoxin subunit beta-like [Anableps anableps]
MKLRPHRQASTADGRQTVTAPICAAPPPVSSSKEENPNQDPAVHLDSCQKWINLWLQRDYTSLRSISRIDLEIVKHKGSGDTLDLSYNHPGEAGTQTLSAGADDGDWKLETLKVEPSGVQWLTPGLRKYSCSLTVDLNTISKHLKLTEGNRKVMRVKKEQPYPDHPDRFDLYELLCTNVLTGRCYWEVEWSGRVYVAVSYRGIKRKGESDDAWFGFNENSWSLICSDEGYAVWHNSEKKAFIRSSSSSSSSSSSVSSKVAVYVDHPAGTLSFYRVSSDTLIHLHTFNTKFTEPLYAGFGLGSMNRSRKSWFSF